MAMQYTYNYVEIDPTTNMCINFWSTSSQQPAQENVIEVPVNDPEYLLKYYNWDDGKFYYDAEYTQEYISPLL